MTASFTPGRSDAIRAALIDRAAVRRPRRRLLLGIALVAAGALAGAGVSTAAFAATGTLRAAPIAEPSGHKMPGSTGAVDAPPGTVPGAPVVSLLGSPQPLRIAGDRTWSLADRPSSATEVRVTISALTTGTVAIGTSQETESMASFNRSDVDSPTATTWFDVPLTDATTVLHVVASSGFTASATLQYLAVIPTHLATNARGETYGVEGGPDGTPDLIRVTATTSSGSQVDGYARATDLDAFSPDHTGQPANPSQALAWQQEREQKYPNGWSIPVFESDGVTQVGTFHIG